MSAYQNCLRRFYFDYYCVLSKVTIYYAVLFMHVLKQIRNNILKERLISLTRRIIIDRYDS